MNNNQVHNNTVETFQDYSALRIAGPINGALDPDEWMTPARFAMFLMAIILATFPKIALGSQTFFYRDYLNFGYPLALYFRESFWRGEVPLWNPLSHCGAPFLAQWNTQTLYPFSLFYLIFPMTWAMGVFCLLHLFWAGMGTYFLAHRWTGSRLAAAIAGLTFGFNGLSWYSTMWPGILCSLAWMPWTVLTAELAWRNGGGRIILAGVVGAIQMLTGTPEVSVFTWIVIGSFWILELLTEKTLRARRFGRLLLIVALVTALSAAQLLPFLDLLAHSHRSVNFGTSFWSMPISGWANYLVPLFHEHPSPQGVFMQYKQAFLGSYYLGIGIIALALLGFWRIRERNVWMLAILAMFSLVMAMGDDAPFYGVFRDLIPLLGFMRYPIKWVMLTTFVIPLLAGYGLSWLRLSSADNWRPKRQAIVAVALVLVVAIGGVAWYAVKFPEPADNIPATLWNALCRIVFLFFASGLLWIITEISGKREMAFVGTALLIFLWMDVRTHAPQLAPTASPELLRADAAQHGFAASARLSPGGFRVMETADAYNAMNHAWPTNPLDDVTARRAAMFENLHLLDHVPKVKGLAPLYLSDMHEITVELNTSTNNLAPLEDFLGISYVSDPENITRWVPRGGSMPIISAGQQPIFADGPNTLRGVTAPEFDPRRFVYLPMEARPDVAATFAPQTKILASHFSAQKVDVDVEALAPAMLVIAQGFYHPWHAYVDDKPVRLWEANHAFQAVEVLAGRHHVRLQYRDRMFRWGVTITVLTLTWIGCLMGHRLLARRNGSGWPKAVEPWLIEVGKTMLR